MLGVVTIKNSDQALLPTHGADKDAVIKRLAYWDKVVIVENSSEHVAQIIHLLLTITL